MKRAILIGLAMVCLVIYLVLLNGESVDFRLTTTWLVHWNVGALIGGAFVAGVFLVLTVVALQAGQRAFIAWRSGRRQRRSDRIDQWTESGEQLIWGGDVARGRALLQRAWQRRPDDPRAVLALAASFRDTGELHRARGVLFDAVDQRHTDPDILLALADTHRAAGEHGPRIEVLERLRALHPQAPRVVRALRDGYIDAARWQDAATLQDVLVAQIRDPQQAIREREYETILRYQAALQLREPAARVDVMEGLAAGRSVPVPVLVSLGDALVAAGRPEDASAVWERAIRTTPRTVFVERLNHLATTSQHRDRLRAVLRKVRPNQGDANNLHLTMARLHLLDGSADDAARELQAVQDHDTAAPSIQRLWADVHRQRGQVDQALAAHARADGADFDTYQCKKCQRITSDWIALCPQCRQWDSYRAAVEIGRAES